MMMLQTISKKKHFYWVAILVIAMASCHKKDNSPTPPETSTVTDVDNNVYQTVKIGDQWWMAENLKVTHYQNGKPIKYYSGSTVDSTAWANETSGSYCKYDNNPNIDTQYGLLYNWYAVVDTHNIAPAGWHVASDNDWKTLEKYLGMSQADADNVNWRGANEADKMKVASPEDWASYGTVWSTNESGFSAKAGSCRVYEGSWGVPGTTKCAFWWTSTAHTSDNQAWFRNLDYKKSNVFRYHVAKSYGMSIRCVKN